MTDKSLTNANIFETSIASLPSELRVWMQEPACSVSGFALLRIREN
jgi:hypothetical protein